MQTALKRQLGKLSLQASKKGFIKPQVPKFELDTSTLNTFAELKNIYAKTQTNGLKVWVAGSWAVAGLYGDFIKNTQDIDLSVETLAAEEKLTELLVFSGYVCKGTSPFGAIKFIHRDSQIEVDIGSIQNSATAFKDVFLHENEFGELQDFKFRIIPPTDLITIYERLLGSEGRDYTQDLQKLKILYWALNE